MVTQGIKTSLWHEFFFCITTSSWPPRPLCWHYYCSSTGSGATISTDMAINGYQVMDIIKAISIAITIVI